LDSTIAARAISKIGWRHLPLLLACFVIAFLDRVNIGFAALTMNADLTFSASVSGLGAVLFFLTYVALEVPSNLALDRYGARRSPARLGGEDETATAPTAAE
jgi:MFS transporter, ACS family, tartrate transporter